MAVWVCIFICVDCDEKLLSELSCHLLPRAQQLLLVKIQKLMCRGGREEVETLRGLRVSSFWIVGEMCPLLAFTFVDESELAGHNLNAN